MKAAGWGRIVNIASAHGLTASPYKSAYVAAKHGVLGLTKTVALEMAEAKLAATCNAVCPGYVLTPIIESQIVQTAPMAITLRVVPDLNADYSPEQLSGVMDELRLRLGQVSITVEEADSLPRGASGKLRAVIGLSLDKLSPQPSLGEEKKM